MSSCRVEKRVWQDPDRLSEYTCLYYELDVDETPQRGYELFDGHWFSGRLSFVVWNPDDQQFKCRVEDEVPCADSTYDYSHKFLIQNALQQGWRVCQRSELEIVH